MGLIAWFSRGVDSRYTSEMHHVNRASPVGTEFRPSAVVKYGRIAIITLGLTLGVVTFLPNGSYMSGRSVMRINALSSPFSDYGVVEISIVVVVILLTLLTWARQWREVRKSAWGSVFICAGLLGTLLPDLWRRNTVFVSQDVGHQAIAVTLQYGFWINLSLVVTLLIISSIVLWNEPRLNRQARYGNTDAPNYISI